MSLESEENRIEEEPITGHCDKCGGPVRLSEDAVTFQSLIDDTPLLFLVAQPRHLLPKEATETTLECVGSPSRARYIPGQPDDPRYPWDEENAANYRSAFARIRELTHNGLFPLTYEMIGVMDRGMREIEEINRRGQEKNSE